MAFLSGDDLESIDSGLAQQAHNDAIYNQRQPQPAFSPWDTGAGSMIGAGSSSGYGSGDLNGDGLDDSTGYAVGVMPDSNSPSGFSYNGTPTYSNGAVYTPSAPAPASPAPYYGLDTPSPDANGDGLNDATGLAVGVAYDPSSPTGYSYNGQPTYGNGAAYYQPADNSASLALNYGGGQDQYLGQPNSTGFYSPPDLTLDTSQFGIGQPPGGPATFNAAQRFAGDTGGIDYQTGHDLLNYGAAAQGADYFRPNWDIFNTPDQAIHDPYAQYRDALGNVNSVVDPYNPAVNPETAREDIYGSASSGGNPFNVVATGLLNQWNVPGADIIGPSIGTLADAATFGAGSGMAGGNMDVYDPAFWGEAGMAAANAGSLGLGGGIIKNAGANIAGNLAGKYIPQGLQQYSETNLPGADIAGNPYVQTGAGILGAIGAGVAGYAGAGALASGVKRAPGAFDKAITGLDARINEPAGAIGVADLGNSAGVGGRKLIGDRTVGLPPGVKTEADLTALNARIKESAFAGEPFKHWYENSGAWILDANNGDVDAATKSAALIAWGSTDTSVKGQGAFFPVAHAEMAAGAPITKANRYSAVNRQADEMVRLYDNNREAFINKVVDLVSQSATDAKAPKVGAFFTDLLDDINPSLAAEIRVRSGVGMTVDRWMARAYGFDSDVVSPAQRAFIQADQAAIAAELGWKPKQVQAATWVNHMWEDLTAKATAAGKVGPTIEEAGMDYSQALARHVAQISLETMPAEDSAMARTLAGIFEQPPQVQAELHAALSRIGLDEAGHDILAREMQLPILGRFEGPGVEKGPLGTTLHPVTQIQVSVPSADSLSKGIVSPVVARQVSDYAALTAVFRDQRAVPWTRVFDDPSKFHHNGMLLDLGREIDGNAAKAIADTLDDSFVVLPHPQGAIVFAIPDDFDVVARGASLKGEAQKVLAAKNTARRAAIDDAINRVFPQEPVKTYTIATDGAYVTREMGEELLNAIGAPGSPAYLTPSLRETVYALQRASRETAEDFAAKYGLGEYAGRAAAAGTTTPASVTGTLKAAASRLSDETGALDMGAIGARFGEAGKRAANIFADAAQKEGRPTTGGIFDMIAPTEKVGTGLVRRYEGKVGTAGLELKQDLDLGNKLLRQADIPKAKWDGTRLQVERSPEMEQLFKALHGEGPPPPKLQKAYDTLKDMVAKETVATVDADKAFVPRDDYFYRGWREVPVGKTQRAGTGKGQFGATPGFMKPRSDQSFSDILKTVYTKPDGTQVRLEPVSWNPFEMAAIRKTAGEQFRAQQDLLAGLKETKLAVPADMTPEGWRVPHVGPAFEGKPFAFEPGSGKTLGPMDRLAAQGTSPAIGYTQRWAVPDAVANDIEAIFGRTPSFGSLDTILSLGQKAKQSKLLMSLFQQMDFSARTLGSLNAGVIDELATTVEKAITLHPQQSAAALYRAGRKFLAVPKHLAELPIANVSGSAQRKLRAEILSGKPIFKERPGITLKGISEAGAKFGTDISLVTRDFTKDLGKPPAGLSTGVVGRRIRQVNAASQRGLFDGVYVQAQKTSLENTILPRIMRQHPDWTDAQIMAASADQVNKMFSTLGEYQTAIKNPAVKKLTRALIFSTNESEALLRGAASTVVGPNKRLWTEFYLGTFLSLAATAELINYATTGEHLPLERLNPIDTENKYGPLPFGYRTNFLAPDIPIKGRNNTNLTLDTVMQLDTVFRLLDPKAFVESRENVLPRALGNQITGKDFFGRPLGGWQDRLGQAAIDLAEPIGMGNIRAAADIGPDSEARIGKWGALIQATGGNVRAENNAALRDRAAVEYAKANGITNPDGSPITKYEQLDTLQRPAAIEANPDIKRELEKRGEEAAAQGSEYATASAKRDADRAVIRADNVKTQTQIDEQYIDPNTQLPKSFDDGKKWREDYGKLQYAIVKQNKALAVVDPFTGKGYGTAMDKAIDRYFAVIDQNQKGVDVDWDAVDAWKAANPEDAALIDEYTAGKENKDLTPIVTAKKEAQKAIETSGFFDLGSYDWEQVKKAAPDAAGFASYDEYRNAVLDSWKKQYMAQGYDAEKAASKASSEFSNTAIAKAEKAAQAADNATQTTWMLAHPDEAIQAWKWGYFNPQKTVIGVNGLPKGVSELQWLTDYAARTGR